MFKFCLRRPRKPDFSGIVDELELEVVDVVGVGVVDEFKVGEQKLCRREFGGGRRVGGAPLVVVVSAPQLQLQSSTGNTVAGHWTSQFPPFNAIAIINRQDCLINVLSSYPKNV